MGGLVLDSEAEVQVEVRVARGDDVRAMEVKTPDVTSPAHPSRFADQRRYFSTTGMSITQFRVIIIITIALVFNMDQITVLIEL